MGSYAYLLGIQAANPLTDNVQDLRLTLGK